ncbi:MAG: hypothetical protein LBG04_00430 [Holosporaceae bacterium]|nr:hypothetical protein [Holosporaceae bacterium]
MRCIFGNGFPDELPYSPNSDATAGVRPMLKVMRKFLKNSTGSSMLECVLIIALVAIVAMGILGYIGRRTHEKLSVVSSAVKGEEKSTEPTEEPTEEPSEESTESEEESTVDPTDQH